MSITAAYRPVRELIKQERLKDEVSRWPIEFYLRLTFGFGFHFSSLFLLTLQEKKRRAEEGQKSGDTSAKENREERVITIRPLNMEDFKEAKNQVNSSLSLRKLLSNQVLHCLISKQFLAYFCLRMAICWPLCEMIKKRLVMLIAIALCMDCNFPWVECYFILVLWLHVDQRWSFMCWLPGPSIYVYPLLEIVPMALV